jgi:hypothetical protein
MKLRDEMFERMKATPGLAEESPDEVFTGWAINSEDWTDSTYYAVSAVMPFANALMEMVLRLAEAIDELRDAPDV